MSTPAPIAPRVRFGPFELDAAAGELRKSGVLIKLQPQPFRILQLLIERSGVLVTREEIQHFVWDGSTFVDFEHGINFSINQIRGALADDSEKPRYIETLPRRGYRFIASVAHETPPQPVPSLVTPGTGQVRAPEPSGGSQPAGSSEFPAPASTAQPIRAWRKLAMGAAAVLIVAVGFAGFSKYWETFHKPKLNYQGLKISRLTGTGNVENVAISPDGRYVAYALRDARGSSLRVRHVDTRGDVEVLPPDRERARFHGFTFSPDGERIYFVQENESIAAFNLLYEVPLLGGSPHLLSKYADARVSFSPDGQQIATTDGVEDRNLLELRIANADGTGDHLLATIANGAEDFQPGPAWSPDGKTIAVSVKLREERLRWALDVVSVRDRGVRELYSSNHEIGRPGWLPEGNIILVPSSDQTGRGQVWAISYPRGEAARLTNDLENYYKYLDVTRDGKSAALLATKQVSDIFIVPQGEASRARKISSSATPLTQVAAMPLGKVLADGADGQMWLMDADGGQQSPFAGTRNSSSPAVCGARVVFDTSGDGAIDLVRTDGDGLNSTKLFSGQIGPSTCSPDGKSVYFANLLKPNTILRLSIEGGVPTVIATSPGADIIGRLAISPDGKFLAFAYDEGHSGPGTKLAVLPLGGDHPIRTFHVLADVAALRWSPDGQGLQYLLSSEATNIWEQPLAGGPPRQITKFTSDQIFDFSWSADRKDLLLARGKVTGDVVLLSNLR